MHQKTATTVRLQGNTRELQAPSSPVPEVTTSATLAVHAIFYLG